MELSRALALAARSSPHRAVGAKGTTFLQDQEDKSPGVEMMLAQGRFGGRKTRPHQNRSRDS